MVTIDRDALKAKLDGLIGERERLVADLARAEAVAPNIQATPSLSDMLKQEIAVIDDAIRTARINLDA
jgi:hypothetical protein